MPLFTPELEFSDDYPTIEPSLRLDFANARALDPRITFTRDSVATYVGRDGLIKTVGVNEPRFDHDPATGESLGLLIEEERTNLAKKSESLSNTTYWTQNFNVSAATAPSITAPDGSTDTWKLVVANNTSQQRFALNSNQGTFAANTYTWSVFAKAAEYSYLGISLFDGDYYRATFDLSNGTAFNVFDATANITPYPNGWYRCSITATTAADLRNSVNYVDAFWPYETAQTAGAQQTGDGTSGVYVWGPQLEVGPFLSSYVTTGDGTSSVTREKEIPVIETSSIDFKDFTQGGEGTLVCEFSNADANGSDIAVSFSGDTHNGATFVGLGTNSNRNAFNRVRVDSTNTVLSVDSNFTTTGFYKLAFGIGQSRCTLAVRGSSSGVLEDTSVSYDSTPYTKLILGCDQTSSSSNNMINGTIKSVFYYPTLLTDTQLQTLTQ